MFTHMKNISLPPVNFTGGQMTNIVVTLHQPDDVEKDIDFELNPKNKSIIFMGEELKSEIVGDFEASILFVKVKGTAYVNITGMCLTMENQIGSQKDPETVKYAPKIELLDMNIEVNPE
jgi:hypothetical protein